jgi:tRNA/rRNA methyltransferase
VRLYDRTEDALAGLVTVYATTARRRDMVRPIVTPHQAALEMRAKGACGLLFGPERTGLVNDDVALADAVITVPLNPAFCSLNLAQAVLLVGYEWFTTGDNTPPRALYAGAAQPATKEDLLCLFAHLERELEIGGFFTTPEQRPTMVRNVRNIFHRMDMTDQEVRTFHGIVAALSGHKKPRE